MHVGPVLLTDSAALDIAPHILHEAWPPEFRSDELPCLQIPRVTCSFMVMAMGEDGVVEGILRGDIDLFLAGEDVVIILPV